MKAVRAVSIRRGTFYTDVVPSRFGEDCLRRDADGMERGRAKVVAIAMNERMCELDEGSDEEENEKPGLTQRTGTALLSCGQMREHWQERGATVTGKVQVASEKRHVEVWNALVRGNKADQWRQETRRERGGSTSEACLAVLGRGNGTR